MVQPCAPNGQGPGAHCEEIGAIIQTVSTAAPIEKDIILPIKGWVSLRLGELLKYRELLYFLIWRDVKVRYKQTVLGAAWAVLQPFCMMLVFTLFFGILAGIGPKDGSYPLWCFCGMVTWTFFATGITQSANSLVGSANLVKKVYFPRLVIPIAAILAGVLDFFIAFIVLLGMMAWYGVYPGLNALLVPVFFLLALITCLGVGLWLSALNAQFRDIRFTVPFLVQIWMFCTPLAYRATLVPPDWREVYAINPMVGVVEGMRWALLGRDAPDARMLAVSAGVAVVLFVSGAFYFRRMEQRFADLV